MLNEEEIETLTHLIRKFLMTVEDQILALQASVTELQTAVAAIPTVPVAPTVDFTPVLNAIAAVAAQLQPTPVAPVTPAA